MIITSSTSKAVIDARRALSGSRPIVHLVTDDFEQALAVMEQAFFGHEPGRSFDSGLYTELHSIAASETAGDGEERWRKFAREKRVIYCSADKNDEPDREAQFYLLRYAQEKSMSAQRKGAEGYESCMMVYGKRLILPPLLETQTARVEFAPLCLRDFTVLLMHYGLGEEAAGKHALWYMNQLAGFTEQEVRGILETIHYGPYPGENLADQSLAEKIIRREKNLFLSRHGKLECVQARDRGEGLKALRDWLQDHKENIKRTDMNDEEDITKGILLLGLPGTGKSMMAKCTASILGLPLLKLEMSRILGGIVGESEKNLDQVLSDLAVAGAPGVLWIDEVEKAFAGAGGKNTGDSGVTRRLFGKLLGFMQEMKRPIFIVATANDISALPPEFTRTGRFSLIFSLMLPCFDECVGIMESKLERHLGYRDKELAEMLMEICGGTEESPRFLTGADITGLASELCIKLGQKPGSGFAAGYKDEEKKQLRKAAAEAMEELLKSSGVTADARLPRTMERVAESYCRVLECSAVRANSGPKLIDGTAAAASAASAAVRANSGPELIGRDNFRPGRLSGSIKSVDPVKERPLCLEEPKDFDRLKAYDKRMFRWIGRYMDLVLSKKQ